MESWNLCSILLATTLLLIAAGDSSGDPWRTENCPADLMTRLKQAKSFLVDQQKVLENDFEVEGRKGQQRRAERQLDRRVEKVGFKCKRGSCDTHTAAQSVVGGNKIRICPDILAGRPFCGVVSVVAHELGHNAHIPKARAGRHHKRGHDDPDQVYQFGYFAGELCKEQYGTGFHVGDGSTPRPTAGPSLAEDLILYPRKDYRGHPTAFSIAELSGSPSGDQRYARRHSSLSDLRFIGLNNNTTSIRVNRGRWKVCSKPNLGGTCKTISASTAHLKSLGMNNKISSIEYLGG